MICGTSNYCEALHSFLTFFTIYTFLELKMEIVALKEEISAANKMLSREKEKVIEARKQKSMLERTVNSLEDSMQKMGAKSMQ